MSCRSPRGWSLAVSRKIDLTLAGLRRDDLLPGPIRESLRAEMNALRLKS